MYLSFYGLREAPFELTSNPEFLFYTGQHREALNNLEYGLTSAKAITLLTGEAGTGKTTLLHAALRSDRCRAVRAIFIHNPTLTRSEFFEMIATKFDLDAAVGRSKAGLITALEPLLRERRRKGQQTVLVVDEAQTLSNELLEEIRLLGNIDTETEKLLPVVLAAQPELTERLNQYDLRQLKQRVALRCHIGPLTLDETAAYIVSRIRKAGGDTTKLFTRDAVTLIHKSSGGIPRTVNVLCDNALSGGFVKGKRPVNRATVLEVCRDFDLPCDDEPVPERQEKSSDRKHERTTPAQESIFTYNKSDWRIING
jgi:type II secretory pathway predicted ATPase ExeA